MKTEQEKIEHAKMAKELALARLDVLIGKAVEITDKSAYPTEVRGAMKELRETIAAWADDSELFHWCMENNMRPVKHSLHGTWVCVDWRGDFNGEFPTYQEAIRAAIAAKGESNG